MAGNVGSGNRAQQNGDHGMNAVIRREIGERDDESGTSAAEESRRVVLIRRDITRNLENLGVEGQQSGDDIGLIPT